MSRIKQLKKRVTLVKRS